MYDFSQWLASEFIRRPTYAFSKVGELLYGLQQLIFNDFAGFFHTEKNM